MSNLLFPTLPPNFSIDLDTEFNTAVSPLQTGREQRLSLWRFPKYAVSLSYSGKTLSDIDDLYQFYKRRKGSFSSFWFLESDKFETMNHYEDMYIGRGDGITTLFDLPGADCTDVTIYENGIAISDAYWDIVLSSAAELHHLGVLGVDYIISGGSGIGNGVQFVGGYVPSDESLLTCDFTGRLKTKMRFESDKMSKQIFTHRLCSVGVRLVQAKGDEE